MASWPGTLPTLSTVNDYREQLADRTIRTEMDQGPDKVRKLTNAQPDLVQFSQPLTLTQAGTLETFYKTTLNGGADFFTDSHPRTGSSVDMRFTRPPRWSWARGLFKAQIELEILP